MLELATSTNAPLVAYILPSIVSAVAAIVASVLLVRQNARAQSYEQLLRDLDDRQRKSDKRVVRHIERALQRTIGTQPPHRRFYERPAGEEDPDFDLDDD